MRWRAGSEADPSFTTSTGGLEGPLELVVVEVEVAEGRSQALSMACAMYTHEK